MAFFTVFFRDKSMSFDDTLNTCKYAGNAANSDFWIFGIFTEMLQLFLFENICCGVIGVDKQVSTFQTCS